MKAMIRIKTFFTVFGILGTAFTYNVYAQDDLDAFLTAGIDNAEKLTEKYIEPFMVGAGAALNNGWYTTAAAHKSLGFELNLTMSASIVPDEDELFEFIPSEFNDLELISPTDGRAPTAFGPAITPRYRFTVSSGGQTLTEEFDGPAGFDLAEDAKIVPVPMVTLGVGVYKNTDIKFRFIPSIQAEDVDFSLFGIGIQHDVKQHIPGLKVLPFHMSVLFGYTQFDSSVDLEGTFDGNNQEGIFDLNAFTFQVLGSKKISVLTVYGGVGLNTSKSIVQVNGEYDITYSDPTFNTTFEDPVDLEFRDTDLRGTIGLRLKFGFFGLYGDYTLYRQNVATVGLTFGIREVRDRETGIF